MTTLGTWPQDIYYLSWMTQRLANRAPEWTHARKWSWSILQQLLNPIGSEIEKTNRQLVEERDNIFLSSTDITLMDKIYYVDLGPGIDFDNTEEYDGIPVYQPPSVYATISGTEYQLTMAEHNDIESFWYNALPSRIEDGETSAAYEEVIPRTLISELSDVTPSDLPIYGHLHITIRDNATWSYRGRNKIYYPKVFIRGTTRKGTYLEEAIPIRYNGTFKTMNQWKAVESVFVSYMDETAYITVEVLPFDKETQLDTKNLFILPDGTESWRFLRIEDKIWGSMLRSEGYASGNFDIVRMGVDTLDWNYRLELLNSAGNNVSINASTIKPNTDYVFCIDNTNLYIYNSALPCPNLTVLEDESPDIKMNLFSDRWVYNRDDTAVIKTDILDITSVPYKFRWTLLDPDGDTWYVGIDGTTWPTSTDAWISNKRWEEAKWFEQRLELNLDQTGVYVLSLECVYSDPDHGDTTTTLTTRFVMYVPAVQPETTLSLPAELQNATDLMFDSDGRLWFWVDDNIVLGNVYYDYFMADYERKRVYLREEYTSARVVV